MKKQMPQAEPLGYRQLWVSSGVALLLPTRVVAERQRAEEQRREAEEAQATAEREARRASAPPPAVSLSERAEAARARLTAVVRPLEPLPGWHRVLPGLDALEHELTGVVALGRSADNEVNDRRKKLIQKLVQLGPDRRIAVPDNWRQAIDELEAALPHFRQPVRAIRNALALAAATGTPPRIAPQLLLGPPGVGKTFYSNKVAQLLGCPRGSVAFDQPGAGSGLRGSDKFWANSETGLLFNLICLGEFANPVILLDEVDKAVSAGRHHGGDQLAQLHGALEPETSRSLRDISVDVEFDASLVNYIATANSLHGVGAPILSRMEVSVIEAPDKWEAYAIAESIVREVLRRLKLDGQLRFERGAMAVLAHLSPRRMIRTAEQAVAAAVVEERDRIGEEQVWAEVAGEQERTGPMLM